MLQKLSKQLEKIRKNKRQIPFVGEHVYRLMEYLEYVFKYRTQLKQNEKYRNLHKGKRVFIIGNGPSLLQQDLSLLRDEYTITVNSMTSTKEFNVIKPKYHVIVDYVRFDKNNKVMYQNLESFKKLKHKPIFVFPIKFKKEIEDIGIDKEVEIIYLYPHGKLKTINNVDLTKRIPIYTNVNNVSLFLALYLGFSEIYLLGCDMTGIVKVFNENEEFDSGGHFYNSTKDEKAYIKDLQTNRTNETFLSSYAQTFRIFRFTQEYAKRTGITIFNATKGGTLDVFPRVKYENLFKKK